MLKVSSLFKSSALFAVLASAVCFLVAPDMALAQATDIDVSTMPSFDTALDSIKTTVGTIIVAALGIGLTVWAARYLFHVVKSMGR